MTIGMSDSLRTARAQAIITAAGANARIKFYNGSRPVASGGAIGGAVLLATLIGGAVLGTAASGVLDFDEASFTQSNASHVTGTPTWVRITTSADAFVADLSIPGDVTFLGSITTGVDVTLGSSTITEPA